jgi:hypothetical protein
MNSTAERSGAAPGTLSSPRAAARPVPVSDQLLAARRRTALVVGLLSLAGVTAALIVAIVRANGGTFTYLLDDPYIHLSIARNLAQHGSYGVVPGVYESASSSPGWVALLTALIKAFPAGAVWYPLALNLLAAGGVLALVLRGQRWLFQIGPAWLRLLAYVALPLALYLPALVLMGMEHTLHALLAVLLLLLLRRALERGLSRRELAAVAGVALLAGSIRYETLFLVGGAALALVVMPSPAGVSGGFMARLRRPEVWAFLLPPIAVTLLLGAINLHNGQYFLPNSVLAKSGLGAGKGLAGYIPSLSALPATLRSDLQMAGLFLAGAVYLAVRRRRGLESGLWLTWIAATVLHVLYARFGWYDRYQGYLVITGTLLVLRSLPEVTLTRRRVGAALAITVLFGALPIFKAKEQAGIARTAHSIYQHNTAMGRFLATAYAGKTVLVNDIGEVSWQHSAGGLVDIWALGSYDVLRAFREGRMNQAFVASLAARDGVQVAAVWGALHRSIPDSWVEVARWSVAGTGRPDEVNDLVFYAPTAQTADALRQAMRSFAPTLPADVQLLWVGGSGA